MQIIKATYLVSVVALSAAGCLDYGSSSSPECQNMMDCNPGKECGEMVRCVDGKCDPNYTTELPCEQGCQNDADCPEGMHCRINDDTGVCVADWTCADVSECLGLEHDDCLGSFECTDGMCGYRCFDLTNCDDDSDCVLADRACCCGSGVADYIAIREDKLSLWQNRAECQGVACPGVECMVPEGLHAICEQGQCAARQEQGWYDCEDDSDCIKVPSGCCGCSAGDLDSAVNADYEDEYMEELSEFCSIVDPLCPMYDTCTDWPAVCHQGTCMTLRDKCGCGDTWDPVCGGTGAKMMTLGSECEADCVEMEWYYHGRCECQMDCAWDPCFGACAENGVTYWCGRGEIECNGQQFLYEGECDPDCENCLLIGRPWMPVCDEDFCSRQDRCFAECREHDWWHTGECLTGEGSMCGGIGGLDCEYEDLFCLLDDEVLDAPGVCIVLGHCLEPEHCEHQPLAHDECEGQWDCVGHECTWDCY